MKKTTIAIMIFMVLLLAVAGCNKTAEKMDDIADGWGSDNSVSTSSYGGRQMMIEPEMVGAPEMAVKSQAMMIEHYDSDEMYYPEPMPPYEEHYGDDVYVEQKIVRTASMNIMVEDYFLASQKTEAYAKKYGGYVSNSNGYKDHNGKNRGTVTLRIPELHYDAVMAELTLLGDVQSKNTNGQDVTEQYMDTEARLKNSEAHEERVLAMYENASNVNEMMNVERELNRVREQVERYEGQLRYMDSRVSYSTVSVTLYEEQPVVKEWGIWKAIKQSVANTLSTVRVLILLFGWLLPLALIVGLIVFIVKTVRKKGKRHRR